MQHGDAFLAGLLVQGARVLGRELVQQLGGAGVTDELVGVPAIWREGGRGKYVGRVRSGGQAVRGYVLALNSRIL